MPSSSKWLAFLLFAMYVPCEHSIPLNHTARPVWSWLGQLEVPRDYVVGAVGVLSAYGTVVFNQYPVKRMDSAGFTRSKIFLLLHIILCSVVLLSCASMVIIDSANVDIRLIGRVWYKVQPHVLIFGTACVAALEATAISLQKNRMKEMANRGVVGVVRAGQQFGIGLRLIQGYRPAIFWIVFTAMITAFNLIGTYSAGAVLNSMLSVAGLLILVSGAGIPTFNNPQQGDGSDTETTNAVFGSQEEVNILGSNYDTPVWLLLLERKHDTKTGSGGKPSFWNPARDYSYKLSSSKWGIANAHAAITDCRVRAMSLTPVGSAEIGNMIKSFEADVEEVYERVNTFYNVDRTPKMETMLLLAGKAKFLDHPEFWENMLTPRQRLIEIALWTARYQATLRRFEKKRYVSPQRTGSCRARWCYRGPVAEKPEDELNRLFGSVGHSSFIGFEKEEDEWPTALWHYARIRYGDRFGFNNRALLLWIYAVYRHCMGTMTLERPNEFPVGSMSVPAEAADLLFESDSDDSNLEKVLRPCPGDWVEDDIEFGKAPIPKAVVHQGRQVLRKAAIAQGIVYGVIITRELI